LSQDTSRKEYVKAGVSIPVDLYEAFNDTLKGLGITSRSQGIQMAIRSFLALHSWKSIEGDRDIAGSILIIYSHNDDHVEEELTDIQHEYLDIIASVLHVHLSRDKCMEIIAVKGRVSRIRDLVRALGKVRLEQLLPLITTY